MKKQQYLEELRQCLKDVTDTEREDALRYCEEYFEEAGPEHEDQAIEELGKPAKFAAQIKAEAAIRVSGIKNSETEYREEKKAKSSLHNIWMIFLGILAMPIALPLMLAAIILMVVFFLVIICLIISGFLISGASLIASIVFLISSFIAPFGAASIIRIGSAFLSLGVGLLLVMGMYQAIHAVIPWFTSLAANLYQKAKGGRYREI